MHHTCLQQAGIAHSFTDFFSVLICVICGKSFGKQGVEKSPHLVDKVVDLVPAQFFQHAHV